MISFLRFVWKSTKLNGESELYESQNGLFHALSKRVAQTRFPMISLFLFLGKEPQVKGKGELYGNLTGLVHALCLNVLRKAAHASISRRGLFGKCPNCLLREMAGELDASLHALHVLYYFLYVFLVKGG